MLRFMRICPCVSVCVHGQTHGGQAAMLVTIRVQQERAEWGGAERAREAEEVGMKEGRAARLNSSWEGERERSGEGKSKAGWFQWSLQSFLQFSSASFLPVTGEFLLATLQERAVQ